MNAHSQPQNDSSRPTSPVSTRTPRWAVAALVLQSLTLLCLFAANGTTIAAGSAAAQSDGDARATIPNAAQQRAEQTKLLATIASELEKTNSKLASMDKYLRSGDLEVRQAQGEEAGN